MGLLSAVFGVGGGLGLVLSGLIVDHLSWRWIFVVGAIGVAVALLLVRRFVPESPVRSTSRIDVPGAVLLSVVLVSFLLALSEGGSWGWTLARRPRALRALRRLARRLDRPRAPRRRAAGRHPRPRRAAGAPDQRHGPDLRLRDVRRLRARAPVRRGARRAAAGRRRRRSTTGSARRRP